MITPVCNLKTSDIPMLQRKEIIHDEEFSRTVSKPVAFPDGTLADMVIASATADERRAKPAIRGPRQKDKTYREVNYAQLLQHAQCIAKAIVAQAAPSPDSFVGILLPRDIEYVEAAFGVLLTGAAYLPLYSSLPSDRMEWYLEDSGAKVVVVSRSLEHLLTPIQQKLGLRLLFIEDIATGFLPARAALEADLAEPAALSSSRQRCTARSLAYMIYTSGTTGKPKGVEVEHAGVVNLLHHHSRVLTDARDLEKSVLVAALIFDSSVRETWLPLAAGGCLCIAEDVFAVTEGTMCAGTPSGLTAAMLPDGLRTVMVGGERLTGGCVGNINAGAQQQQQRKVLNAYGPTEATVECLVHCTDLARPEEEVAWIGVPIWNVDLFGVPAGATPDPATGAWPLARRGEECELFVGGAGVARGYRNAPEKTAAKFIENFVTDADISSSSSSSSSSSTGRRVYRTGDLVRWTPSGDLEYRGRADSQVKLRGYRVELEEVERVCASAPGVGACAVVVKADRRRREHLVAYVTPAADADANADADADADGGGVGAAAASALREGMLKRAAEFLPEYMVPTQVVALRELPFTIGGKVDKRSLPEPDWGHGGGRKGKGKGKRQAAAEQQTNEAEDKAAADPSKPRNATEEKILRAICAMLEIDPADPAAAGALSVEDNIFTEFGFTSIDAALLRQRLAGMGLEVDGTVTILRCGTVRALALHFTGGDGGADGTTARTGDTAGAAATEMERSVLSTVCEMLEVDPADVGLDENLFTEFGLTSIDAALLRRRLLERGLEVDGTAAILRAGTVRALARVVLGDDADAGSAHAGGQQEDKQRRPKALTHEDVTLPTTPADRPLPRPLVWLVSGLGIVLAFCLAYVIPVVLWVCMLSYVHRRGRCNFAGAYDDFACADPNVWLGYAYNVGFTPVVLAGLFVVELAIIWLVKWTVIGRYRTGVYSVWGPMYMRWWFVQTFMSFAYFFMLGPLRCTGMLNCWLRCLGAKIGKNVVLDTAAIYEPDLIDIGDNVTVQSDAALFGHCITRPIAMKKEDPEGKEQHNYD